MSDDATAAAPAGDAAPGAADAATATAGAAAASAASAVSTAAGESATHESAPSLLSSAAGKEASASPDKPAPAADAKSEGKKPEPDADPAKPDDPGKAKAEDKADAATDPAAKDATAKESLQGDRPPAPVSLEDLKLPEGVKLDPEGGKAFVDILNNAELSGKDRGQALIDLHQKEIARVHKELTDHQRKVWDDLNAGWKDKLRKDPELGGNRLNTNLSMAKAVVEMFGGTPDEVRELLIHTDNNGMGNFPGYIRMLVNIGKALNVFEDGIVSSNPKAPAAKTPGNRGWYDKSLNAPGG